MYLNTHVAHRSQCSERRSNALFTFNHRSTYYAALLLIFLAPLNGTAQSSRFRVSTSDEPIAGAIERIDADGTIVVAGKSIPLGNWYALQQEQSVLPPVPVEPHLVTSVGDWIPGRLVSMDESGIRFQAKLGRETALQIPLSFAGILWLSRADTQLSREPLWQDALSRPRRRDVLLLRNRDLLTGTILSLDAQKNQGTIDRIAEDAAASTRTEFELTRLAAVAFNSSLSRTRKPSKPFANLVLANGTRLQLTSWLVTEGMVRGKTLFNADVTVPLRELVQLRIANGRAIYLSDLKPTRYTETPYLGARWEWSADSAWGESLALGTPGGASVFDKGIAMHSTSTLTFALGGRYRRFETMLGVQHGCTGEVDIQIEVDGVNVEVPGGKELRAENARPVVIDVTGKKELTLSVKFGRRGGVQDQIIWGDARLIRKE